MTDKTTQVVKQTRQNSGYISQLIVSDTLTRLYNTQLVSTAKIGQQIPDLVVACGDKLIQIEIKGRSKRYTDLVFAEKSIRRGGVQSKTLTDLATICSKGQITCFEQLIDSYRIDDKAIGFPGDNGVIKSGKIPKQLTIRDDQHMLDAIRQQTIAWIQQSGNNYFAIHNRSQQTIQMFYTGLGENVLNMPELPTFTQASLTTYGRPYKGAMRVALKIKFNDKCHCLLNAKGN